MSVTKYFTAVKCINNQEIFNLDLNSNVIKHFPKNNTFQDFHFL